MRMVRALMLLMTLTVAVSYMGGCTREKVIEEDGHGHGDWHGDPHGDHDHDHDHY